MKTSFVLRSLMPALLFAACLQPAPALARSAGDAGEYPSKPIELVVPFPAGGATDAIGRALAKAMPKYLPNPQPVVVINISGAGGVVGTTAVHNARPDGYRIGLAGYGSFNIQPHYGNTVYTHDGLQQIARVVSYPMVMFVRNDAPWKSFEEWLAYVKQNPDRFAYAVAGNGSATHIAMENINQKVGIRTKAVVFPGGAAQITALLGGHVHGAILGVGEAKSYLESGDLRMLFNAGSQQDEYTADAAWLKQKGIDVGGDISFSAIAPKGTPPAIVATLHDALKKAMEDPEVIEQYRKLGLKPAYASGESVQKELDASFAANREVLLRIGLLK